MAKSLSSLHALMESVTTSEGYAVLEKTARQMESQLRQEPELVEALLAISAKLAHHPDYVAAANERAAAVGFHVLERFTYGQQFTDQYRETGVDHALRAAGMILDNLIKLPAAGQRFGGARNALRIIPTAAHLQWEPTPPLQNSLDIFVSAARVALGRPAADTSREHQAEILRRRTEQLLLENIVQLEPENIANTLISLMYDLTQAQNFKSAPAPHHPDLGPQLMDIWSRNIIRVDAETGISFAQQVFMLFPRDHEFSQRAALATVKLEPFLSDPGARADALVSAINYSTLDTTVRSEAINAWQGLAEDTKSVGIAQKSASAALDPDFQQLATATWLRLVQTQPQSKQPEYSFAVLLERARDPITLFTSTVADHFLQCLENKQPPQRNRYIKPLLEQLDDPQLREKIQKQSDAWAGLQAETPQLPSTPRPGGSYGPPPNGLSNH